MSQIIITEKAAEQVKSIIQKENKPNVALRVYVSGGGCSGFRYGMALDNNVNDGDKVIEANGVKILVDPDSALYLENSKIDYVESMTGGGFVISNPNAEATCGCGHSFTPKGQASSQTHGH